MALRSPSTATRTTIEVLIEEMRAPLHAVLGFAELIADDAAATPSATTTASTATSATSATSATTALKTGLVEEARHLAQQLEDLTTAAGQIAEPPAPGAGSVPVTADADRSADAARRDQMARVLVVDDSPVNQMLTAAQLERSGYLVEILGDGSSALERLEQPNPPDLVFMDWHMPDMDGLETTRLIRQREQATGRDRVPIVALTARAMLGDRAQCLDAGMDDFVSKPASMLDLEAALERSLNAPSASAHSPEADTAQPSTLTMVDETVLAALIVDVGDAGLVDQLLATWLEDLPLRQKELAAGLEQNESEPVRRSAHTLKSTSQLLGGHVLAQASRDLEAASREPTTSAAALRAQVANVLELADRTAEAFRHRLGASATNPKEGKS